jgi:hypothetical protein
MFIESLLDMCGRKKADVVFELKSTELWRLFAGMPAVPIYFFPGGKLRRQQRLKHGLIESVVRFFFTDLGKVESFNCIRRRDMKLRK